MGITQITIQAIVSADRNKTWTCYTEPQHIVNWNFASDDWCCPAASNDLRSGGKYSARMEARDGSWGFDFEAVYDQVIEGEKLAYTMGDGRKAVIDFSNEGSSTVVRIVFEAEDMNPVDMQKAGWQAILNNFKKYVETL
jgi:uncharacterized protein YndB with AHSA1/START domain